MIRTATCKELEERMREAKYIEKLLDILAEIVADETRINRLFDRFIHPFAQGKKDLVKIKKMDPRGLYHPHWVARWFHDHPWLWRNVYYFRGKGTIFLNRELMEKYPIGFVAGILAHEIYHLWDDYQEPWPWGYTLEDEIIARDMAVHIWDELDVNNNIKYWGYPVKKFRELWKSWSLEEKKNKLRKIKSYQNLLEGWPQWFEDLEWGPWELEP